MEKNKFEERLKEAKVAFHPVVPFDFSMKLLKMDFTERNKELTDEILSNTDLFSEYVNRKLKEAGAEYGIGGYDEHRTIYSRSKVFDTAHPDLPEGKATNTQPPLLKDASFINNTPLSEPLQHGEVPPSEGFREALEEPEGQYGYQWADPYYYKQLKEFALEHRNNPTKAEQVLWEAVKAKKLGPFKLRRQHIIDKYIADIVCLDKRLIIEIDGLIHQLPENIESDKIRTETLENKGFKVIRFSNDEVISNLSQVLNKIVQVLKTQQGINESSNLSSPFRGAGGRRILAIDYGKKRTGLAVTDPLQIIASGLTTVETPKLMPFLKDYFSKEEVELVIIGMPTNMDDSDTHATPLVRKFIAQFKKAHPLIPILEVDERFTSKMASQAMLQMGLKKKQRQNKALVDEIAATIMLQEYMRSNSI